ncbi:uncharacterized protein LOC126555720 [Aphis gossypii]|uniref:uncharacterized protein LOC126555720 n=1 Tax=Aphis gossypii TaxID=80765 RepID=UPI0021590584|nr:uncharacterized protein LOC126555720 [Aphis gossypii]
MILSGSLGNIWVVEITRKYLILQQHLKKKVHRKDKILDLITDLTIPTDEENTLNIKKDDCSLTVKTPVDNTAVDYWTIAHYKCAKIDNVALQDRWKHAECSLKISLTGQHPDDLTTAKEMVTLIQSVFDKMMRHPAKKLLRHKPKKLNL